MKVVNKVFALAEEILEFLLRNFYTNKMLQI